VRRAVGRDPQPVLGTHDRDIAFPARRAGAITGLAHRNRSVGDGRRDQGRRLRDGEMNRSVTHERLVRVADTVLPEAGPAAGHAIAARARAAPLTPAERDTAAGC